MPCTVSRSSSSAVVWPAVFGLARGHRRAQHQVAEHALLGLLVDQAGPQLVHREGEHVGRALLLHPLALSSAMVSSSTAVTHSSASGCTRIRSITNRASRWVRSSSISTPDSFCTSMVIGGRRAPRVGRPAGGRRRSSYAATILPTSRWRTTSWAVSRLKLRSSTPSRISSTTRRPLLTPLGQVDLGDVAGDHDLGAEAEPGQEHLHLLGRGVLRLVEDDERVVERAAAHVGQRCDLDGPGREQLGDGLGVEHVVQGVVQRAQVGVDLLAERAGQEPEPLAGLDRGAGQDDPVDLLGLQRLHGLGHREVGLAGAGGPDAEDDGVLVDRVDVALLVQRLGPDRAAAVGQDVEGEHVGRALGRLGAQHRDHALDGLGVTPWPVRMIVTSSSSIRSARATSAGSPRKRDLVAADVEVGVEGLLHQREVLVTGAEQGDHVDAVGHDDGVQGLRVAGWSRARLAGLSHGCPVWGGPSHRCVLTVNATGEARGTACRFACRSRAG